MLWACLRLPLLSLDVFSRATGASADAPFVVTSGGHYPRVVAANAAARTAGIRRDQLISAALALVPEVLMRERDLAAEAAALADVATLLLAFTPNTSLAPPSAVLAEIAGSVRLFGGLPRLLDQLQRQARSRGYEATIGVAPTATAALLFARAGRVTPVLDTDALPCVLAPLPLALLDLDADTLATLKAAGITTFGDAHALPRAGLARRFGQRVVDTLDRALGRAPDPRDPYLPPLHFERRLPLPAPVDSAEALQFAVNRLMGDFADWLLARGLGVLRMSLTLVHERYMRERGTAPTLAAFALGAPARAPAHLNAVLRERLARVVLPAPVEAIVLASDETAPLAGRNLGLLAEDEAASVVVPLVERLRSRLGDHAVATPTMHAEHRPEHAASEAPALAPHGAPQPRTRRTPAAKPRHAKAARHATPAPAVPPRPLWLLDCARPLAGVLEAKPWVLRDGPERIESGWWDGGDCRRDYFVAETPDGEVAWIYRDHRYAADDGEWFMHGLFA
ncbi:MAG TPA: DNA polymerase Y family protein [Casimicrobiaceae bacterium]|nr:DNA polymerase Y family protein [Casimicrobiaceae bacterium]